MLAESLLAPPWAVNPVNHAVGDPATLTAPAALAYDLFVEDQPGRVKINDGERVLAARPGEPVLFTLMGARIFVPSACGGRGICGQCRLEIHGAHGGPTDAEIGLVPAADRARGVRLSCQVPVVGEVGVRLPPGSLDARPYRARVREIRDETTEMRRIVLDLEEPLRFRAGQYVQLVLPGTESAERPVYRAYSVASPPSTEATASTA